MDHCNFIDFKIILQTTYVFRTPRVQTKLHKKSHLIITHQVNIKTSFYMNYEQRLY